MNGLLAAILTHRTISEITVDGIAEASPYLLRDLVLAIAFAGLDFEHACK